MLKAGTVIVCPLCQRPQIRSKKDLLPGSQVKDADWESVGFDLESMRMACDACGTKWHRTHPVTGEDQWHTSEDGWVSFTRNPQPLPKRIIKP